jgi:hypothetical protein
MSDVDWPAIRAEYENGASLRSLASKHGVSKSTIGERKFKEQWAEHRTDTGRTSDIQKIVSIHPSAMPPDAVTIASNLLADLANLAQGEWSRLTYSEHVKASRSLSEYVKVLVTAPRETEAQDVMSIPLNKLSPRTRLAIQRLIDEDEHAQEQENVG